jgi:phospholipase C
MVHLNGHRVAFSAFAVVVMLSGCSALQQPQTTLPNSQTATTARTQPFKNATQSPIQHLIVVVQQGRTFDNLFAGFPGVDAPTTGCAEGSHARPMTSGSGCPPGDTMVELKQIALKADPCKRPSSYATYFNTAWDRGAMDGWNNLDGQRPLCPYTRVREQDVRQYWGLAQQFAVADHMFASTRFGSFANQLYIIAGTTMISHNAYVAGPPKGVNWGCDAPAGSQTVLLERGRLRRSGPFPCFDQWKTTARQFDNADVSWNYYYDPPAQGGASWNPWESIQYVVDGPDWTADMSTPARNILTDIQNGKLRDISWVLSPSEDSDGTRARGGPAWISSIAQALEKSAYWPNSAMVVIWDNPGDGSYYDDVAPPQLDPMGLGFRVPLLVISKYAKSGYVSHTQYEYGSILKFIEETWALAPLGGGATDQRANSISDMFTFTK